MQTISQVLEIAFSKAFEELGLEKNTPVVLQESSKPEFGDYQVNGVMGAAKQLKQNPRELAAKVIELVDLEGVASKLEIAGPGFINITIDDEYLAEVLSADVLNVNEERKVVVVDYSAPNLAKEMHVGHLRSTVIGDSIVRMNEFIGNTVIRRNHVGDWGTQFGMLTAYLYELNADPSTLTTELSDLEGFYRKAKQRFDEDAEFANTAREYVVKLQSGDTEVLNLWRQFVKISLSHCQEVCDRLGTKLTVADAVGESSYNYLLKRVVDFLVRKGVAVDSEGAKCIFFEDGEFEGAKSDTPFIIQKKDGGFLYATTDIAALYDRVRNLRVNKVVYVIDSRQALHMRQLFATGFKSGIAPDYVVLQHAAFGTMMGEDNKPFKTRSGGTVKLVDLLDEAIERAYNMIRERNPEWSDEECKRLADILGIASIKYADLSKNRLSDYVFSFDKMLAFDGNTAPYLLYAYTRINSIFAKADISLNDLAMDELTISTIEEHRLAIHLAKFEDKLDAAIRENYPHYICGYIYELAGLFMKFYEACPILKAETSDVKNSRLYLSAVTSQVLKQSLDLLGIPVVEKM